MHVDPAGQNVDQQTLENEQVPENTFLKTIENLLIHTQVESWKLFHMSCFMTDLVFALTLKWPETCFEIAIKLQLK